jgi:hypothetical protein
MLKAQDVQELLTVLHGQGYRLRKIGADSLEVEDNGPTLSVGGAPDVERETLPRAKDPDPNGLFDHVGGPPTWLRRPKPKDGESPWRDGPND